MRFDVLMPAILFAVTLAALYLGKKAEKKIEATIEKREFKNRDAALMLAMVAVVGYVVFFVPNMAITSIFLFSYTSLLFTISYAFSDMQKKRLTLYCGTFIIISILAGAAAFFGFLPADLKVYGTLAFAALATCAFFALVYAQQNAVAKQTWYVAALSPALFLLLFLFYNGTDIWFPYLLDIYGIIFALLIVLYLGSLFKWKTVFIFAAFLTVLDIILVWVTGTMVQAANAVSNLGLPVLVAFPTIPFIIVDGGILIMRLGLGDFFFAGILATQTMKKFGWKTAVASLLTICISFALFELLLLNGYNSALPATLPIVLGWLPVIVWKILKEKLQKQQITTTASASPENST